MEAILNQTDPLFVGLWCSTWQASVLICLVLFLQWLFGGKLSPGWRYTLWLVVLARLALPITPESVFSMFNIPLFNSLQSPAAVAPSHEISSSAPAVYSPADETSGNIPTHSESVPGAAIPRDDSTKANRGSGQSSMAKAIAAWIPPIWIIGVLLQIARICWQNARFASRVKDRVPVTKPDLLELLEECKRTMKIRLPIALFETPTVRSPALYGLFRPRLLLPQNLTASFSRAELSHVLLHELAHVKRSDMVVNWLMAVLQTLHWFNPLVWFAFRRMRADRESACDALALTRAKDSDPRSYGATIIKLLEGFARSATSPSLMGILEVKSQMQRRIRMIAHFRRPSRWSAWAALLLVALGFVGLTDARIPQPSSPIPGEDLGGIRNPANRPSRVKVNGRVFDETTLEPINHFRLFIHKKQGVTNSFQHIVFESSIAAGKATNGEFSLTVAGNLVGYDVEIRADGYRARRQGWRGLETGDQNLVYALARSTPIQGLLRFPDGQPAGDVEVALWTQDTPVAFDQSGFLNRKISLITRTDAEGRFTFTPKSDPLSIIAVDERGYAESEIEAPLVLQRLTLQPWGRVEGTLLIGRQVAKEQEVGLRRTGLMMTPQIVITDKSGEFVFERVPPGEFTLSRVVNGAFYTGKSVQVRSGETIQTKLGGTGSRIVGRLTWTASGRNIDWHSRNCEVRFYSRTLPRPGNLPINLQSDGSFLIHDVPSGAYKLVITLREGQETGTAPFVPVHQNVAAPSQSPASVFPVGKLVAALEKAVEVPVNVQNDDNTPLDVGTLELKSLPSSLTSRF